MKIYYTIPFLLTGCAYRYGTGYFLGGETPKQPEPEHYPMTIPSSTPQPTASAGPKIPCDTEGVKTTTLEVTNQLDSKNQTIKTTAVTETHETRNPCFE